MDRAQRCGSGFYYNFFYLFLVFLGSSHFKITFKLLKEYNDYKVRYHHDNFSTNSIEFFLPRITHNKKGIFEAGCRPVKIISNVGIIKAYMIANSILLWDRHMKISENHSLSRC